MTYVKPLFSDEFEMKYGFVENPVALRLALLRAKEVLDFRDALHSGALVVDLLPELVAAIVSKFRVGTRLEDDTSLCAIAVAVEAISHPIVNKFITELSRVRATEFRRPASIASECLRHRRTLSKTVMREYQAMSQISVPFEITDRCAMPGERDKDKLASKASVVTKDFRYASP